MFQPIAQRNQLSALKGIDIEEMDCDTCLKTQKILSDEIDDPEFLEFVIKNYSELGQGVMQSFLNQEYKNSHYFG